MVGTFEALPAPPAEPPSNAAPSDTTAPHPPPLAVPASPPPSKETWSSPQPTLSQWGLAPRLLSRRGGIAAAAAALLVSVSTATAPAAWASDGAGGAAFPILGAQQNVRKILEDEQTFKTVVQLGLPLGTLQMPPNLQVK